MNETGTPPIEVKSERSNFISSGGKSEIGSPSRGLLVHSSSHRLKGQTLTEIFHLPQQFPIKTFLKPQKHTCLPVINLQSKGKDQSHFFYTFQYQIQLSLRIIQICKITCKVLHFITCCIALNFIVQWYGCGKCSQHSPIFSTTRSPKRTCNC